MNWSFLVLDFQFKGGTLLLVFSVIFIVLSAFFILFFYDQLFECVSTHLQYSGLCLKEVDIQEWVIMVWSLYMDKWSWISKNLSCAAAPFFRSELGSRQELGKEKVANSMDLAFILCVSAIFYLVIYILLLLKWFFFLLRYSLKWQTNYRIS